MVLNDMADSFCQKNAGLKGLSVKTQKNGDGRSAQNTSISYVGHDIAAQKCPCPDGTNATPELGVNRYISRVSLLSAVTTTYTE